MEVVFYVDQKGFFFSRNIFSWGEHCLCNDSRSSFFANLICASNSASNNTWHARYVFFNDMQRRFLTHVSADIYDLVAPEFYDLNKDKLLKVLLAAPFRQFDEPVGVVPNAVFSIAFNPQGTLLIGHSINDQRVLIWRINDMHVVENPIDLPLGAAHTFAFSSTGTLLAAGFDNKVVRVWQVQRLLENPAAAPLVVLPSTHVRGGVVSLAFDPHDRFLAVGYADDHQDGAETHDLRVWRMNEGEFIDAQHPLLLSPVQQRNDGEVKAHISSVAFNQAGTLLVAGYQSVEFDPVRVWSVRDDGIDQPGELNMVVVGDGGESVLSARSIPHLNLLNSLPLEDGFVRFWRGSVGLDHRHPLLLSKFFNDTLAGSVDPLDPMLVLGGGAGRVRFYVLPNKSLTLRAMCFILALDRLRDFLAWNAGQIPLHKMVKARRAAQQLCNSGVLAQFVPALQNYFINKIDAL